MGNLINGSLVKKLDRLSIDPRLTSDKGNNGQRKSKGHGSSMEFSDFRNYFYGDDIRKIDWNAYGRLEKVVIKLFEEEREVKFNLIIDNSKSMDFGSSNKLEKAKEISALMSYIALAGDDRVILYYLDGKRLIKSPEFKGRNSFSQIVKVIDKIEPSELKISESIMGSDFFNGVTLYLSDFYDEKSIESIKYLGYKKQRVVLLQLLSEDELNPQMSGEVRLVGVEGDGAKNLKINKEIIEKYKLKLGEFIEKNKSVAGALGGYHILIPSGLSMDDVLFDRLIKAGLLR